MRTLERDRPVVFCEVLPNFTRLERRWFSEERRRRNRTAASELWDLFKQINYDVSVVDGNNKLMPVSEFVLDDPTAWHTFNYVARPREMMS